MSDRKPHVLVVTGAFPLGSETFVREQCVSLVERGCDLDILALRPGDGVWSPRDVEAGLADRVRFAPIDASLPRRGLATLRTAARYGLRHPGVLLRSLSPRRGWRGPAGQLVVALGALGGPRRYDAIHCEFGPMGRFMLPMLDAGIVEGPLSVAFYGYDITREPAIHGTGVYDELFARVEVLLPNSTYLVDRLVAAGAPPEKVTLHRLGIRTEDFAPVDRTARRGSPVALAVGRFVEKKGFEYAIRAMALAETPEEWRLRLVGDGALKPSLERLVAGLGLKDRVEFLGWRSHGEVVRLMGESDLFLAPSVTAQDGDMEGMPLVIAEAMATGLPVISTRHSGIPDAARDGENAVLVDEFDVTGLAEALRHFADPEARRVAGESSIGIARSEFEAKTQGDRLFRILQGLGGGGQAHVGREF